MATPQPQQHDDANITEQLLALAKKELDIERLAFESYKQQQEEKLALERRAFELQIHEQTIKQAQQQFEHDKQDVVNFFAPFQQQHQYQTGNDPTTATTLSTTLLSPSPSFARQSSYVSQSSVAASECPESSPTTTAAIIPSNDIAQPLTHDELLVEIDQFREMKYQFELNLQRAETDLLKRMFQVQKIETAIKADVDILVAKQHKMKLRESDLVKKEDLLEAMRRELELKDAQVSKILNDEIEDFRKWKKQSFVDGIMSTLQANQKAWKAVTEQPTIRFVFTNLNKQLILFYDSQTSSMSAAGMFCYYLTILL